MEPNASNPSQTQTHTDALIARGDSGEPIVIPDHQLLRCIGRGSYGEVWLARNMMGVYRAVKIVYRKSFQHERPFERELSGIRKFEPISRSHEGFIDVLHVGINEQQGYFYYVMELGDDQTAAQKIDPDNYSPRTLAKESSLHRKLSAQECLELGLALSQALAELHKHGLVHRDVKPSNIIFVNGVPKLADIGLVAEVSEARSYVGTEGFIPPEGPGAPQGDVYGLGKVLYEASTGKDRQDFPELPTLVDALPDRERFLELNEVILHACKNDPTQRYQSAWEMHADLLVLANGKSVKRLKMLERRFAAAKRLAGISALAVIVVAAVTYNFYREWRSRLEAHQREVGANVANGITEMDAGNLLGALPHLAEALRLDYGNARHEAQHRLRFGSTHAQCAKLVQMWFAPKGVNTVAFTPDGKRVLVVEDFGHAQVFDAVTGEAVSPRFGPSSLRSAVLSPDGEFVVTASEDKAACVWRVSDGKEILPLPHPDKVMSAVFSFDGERIVTGSVDGMARVWNARSGKLELTLKGHSNAVLFATFNHDGSRIVTTSRDWTARIWNGVSGDQVGQPLEHSTWVGYAAFSPDDHLLATACFDNKARVWELEQVPRHVLPDLIHGDGVNSVEFSSDGRLILTAGLDGAARIWRTADHQPLIPNPILPHGERVTCAAFARDGHRIVTSCTDGTVRVWDLVGGKGAPAAIRGSFSEDARKFVVRRRDGVEVEDTSSAPGVANVLVTGKPVAEARLSPNGDFVLTVCASNGHTNEPLRELQVWEMSTRKPLGPAFFLTNRAAQYSLSRDGKSLLCLSGNSARVWNAVTGMPLSPVMASSAFGVLSPDGSCVLTWSDNTARLWDSATGREVFKPIPHDFPVKNAAFSGDGSRFVTCCSEDGFSKCCARVWNAKTGEPLTPPLKHNDGVLSAAFSPDGKRVATASEDFTAVVWDIATGRQLTPPLKHEYQVFTAEFDSAGEWIATAGRDMTARVWSSENGNPLTPPLRHKEELAAARFLANEALITWNRRGSAYVWQLAPDERPVEDLVRLARLLSGVSPIASGPLPSPQSESLQSVWERLRKKYPADFATDAKDAWAWHESQASDCETERQWSAAAFHLVRLLALRGPEQSLVERLARAKQLMQAARPTTQ